VIHLALYNLGREREAQPAGARPPHMFFRWREDLCVWLDHHWDQVQPGRTRTPTWASTVVSYLSTKHTRSVQARPSPTRRPVSPFSCSWAPPRHSFVSGTATLGVAGSWALLHDEPPRGVRTPSGRARHAEPKADADRATPPPKRLRTMPAPAPAPVPPEISLPTLTEVQEFQLLGELDMHIGSLPPPAARLRRKLMVRRVRPRAARVGPSV
jgi:hypothetical protein